AKSRLFSLFWSRRTLSTSRNSTRLAIIVLPLPGVPMTLTACWKSRGRFLCLAINAVSGSGLTIERKAASSLTYSVARRRKGLLIGSLSVAVAPEEKGLHGVGTIVARGLRPKKRNAVVRRVVL